MTSEIDDLKNALSNHLLDSPYDPSAQSSYHKDIDALASLTRDWSQGNASPSSVRNAFRRLAPGFDFDDWAESWILNGIYSEDMLEEDPDED